jgi:hypothetical protein
MLREWRAVLALVSAVALVAGCAGMQANYGQPVPAVYQASLAGLKDMNMSVTKARQDSAGAQIEAKRADGSDVKVNLAGTGPETTDAHIKVGFFGDKDAEKVISDHISARLGEPQCATGRGGPEKERVHHPAPQAEPAAPVAPQSAPDVAPPAEDTLNQ